MKIIGDCHKLIQDICDNEIDLIYFDPPFGTTQKEWDKPLDFKKLFPEFWRVLKPNGAVIIHCSIPFTYHLIRDHSEHLKYHYTWNKSMTSNYLNANKMPLRKLEEILVFYKKPTIFNASVFSEGYSTVMTDKDHPTKYYGKHKATKTIGKKNNPIDYIEMCRTTGDFTRPIELIEYIIKLYSNEGDHVLDITCGYGRSGDVCSLLNRSWTGFDIRALDEQLI